MGFLSSIVIYVAILIRAIAFSIREHPDEPLIPVLLLFGVLLFTEPWITKKIKLYPYIYLIVQPIIAVAAFLIPPRYDFIPTLMIPLTMNAFITFGSPAGYYWITFYSVAMIYPMMDTWRGTLEGFIMLAMFSGLFFLTGGLARQILKLELSRRHNDTLAMELKQTHRELEEYKTRIEKHAAARTRSQMAQEIHDSVTQTIFTVNLAAQTAAMKYQKDPYAAKDQMDRLVELAGNASDEITDLVSLFHPRSVISQGLPIALEALAKDRLARDHLDVIVSIYGDRCLPEETTLILYRIAQEALNNVSRHSGTDRAEIILRLDDRPASMEIIDWGRGFDLQSKHLHSDHYGIVGMLERAAEINWHFSIHSDPGFGTRVKIEETIV